VTIERDSGKRRVAPAAAPPARAADARAPQSVLAYLGRATDFLAQRGAATPRLDAEVLLAEVLATDRVGVYMRFDQPLAAAERDAYRALVRRRAAGEPVAYLTGRREFWSRTLAVTADVLIPRPETELLVERALAAAGEGRGDRRRPPAAGGAGDGEPRGSAGRRLRILDLGTGSGALAVTLAAELADAWVVAVDVSRAAAALARANAATSGVAARVAVAVADWTGALASGARFDVIVSNPPYVESAALAALAPEVRREPRLALDGGADGLDAYRRLVPAASALLAPGASLLLEVGAGQAAAVAALVAACGLDGVACHADLAGVARVVQGTRAPLRAELVV
jgi:release factor glutamine methyltransferase